LVETKISSEDGGATGFHSIVLTQSTVEDSSYELEDKIGENCSWKQEIVKFAVEEESSVG
jgi:hypothetical protein